MSILTVDDLRAVHETTLGDEAVQAAIDREEAWLTRRIGPLVGERTETFRFAGYRRRQYEVRLQRPTDAASLGDVTDYGTALDDVDLTHGGWRVSRQLGSVAFTGPVIVTYTPVDEEEVTGVLLDLVRLGLSSVSVSPGMQSESMGDYSYTLGSGAQSSYASRKALVRSLQEPSSAGTIGVGIATHVGRISPVIESGL